MNKYYILIIDDDEDYVKNISILLKSKGYNICSARNRSEGMNAIKKKRPSLIILDIMMDDITEGFELARELKEDKRYNEIPLIISTALHLVTRFDDKRGVKKWLPGDDYLEKPFKHEELFRKVENLLKVRK